MITLLRIIDANIGALLCWILGFFSFKNLQKKPRKILIVRLWTLGESILTLPMIEILQKKFPGAQIEVLVLAKSAAAVFKPFNFIKKIIRIEVKTLFGIFCSLRKYDLVVDTEPYFKLSALLTFWLGKMRLGFDNGIRANLYNYKRKYNDQIHAAENYVELLKAIGISEKISCLVSFPRNENAAAKVKTFLKENALSQKKIIAIHAGTAGTATHRAWPRDRFAQVIDMLAHKFSEAVFLLNGAANERELNEDIRQNSLYTSRVYNIAGKFSLPELFELSRHLALFISNDTGPMHVAAAQRVRTIGLFGPNLPQRFGPFPAKKNASIYHGSSCSPCINVHKGSFENCPCAGMCMKRIEPREVFEIANRMLCNS